jgi:hypothetical protein
VAVVAAELTILALVLGVLVETGEEVLEPALTVLVLLELPTREAVAVALEILVRQIKLDRQAALAL